MVAARACLLQVVKIEIHHWTIIICQGIFLQIVFLRHFELLRKNNLAFARCVVFVSLGCFVLVQLSAALIR
jgi:hypothetical protein